MLAKILDFAPAIAFFVTYRWTGDLVLATGVIIAGCILSFAIQYLLWRKTSRIQVFMTIAVMLFGLPTILLDDPQIIKWKPSVVNWILAITIGVLQFGLKRNPFAYLFGREMPLPEPIWFKLGSYFMFWFTFVGIVNMVVAFYTPYLFDIDLKTAESWWVNYKTFGSPALNVTFTIFIFAVVLRRHPEVLAMFKEIRNNPDGSEQTSSAASASNSAEPAVCPVRNDAEFENSPQDRK